MSTMTRFLRRTTLALLLTCSLVSSSHAQNDEADHGADQEDYGAVIARGVREFKHGYWAEALAAFRKAHALQPSARTLRGMGLSLFEMRRYAEAAAMMEEALASTQGPHSLTEEQRVSLEQARMEALSYTATLEVRLVPAEAKLLVDGERQHLTTFQVDQGRHQLRAEGAGQVKELTVSVEMGERRQVTIDLASAAAGELSANPPEASPSPRPAPTSGGGLPALAVAGLIGGGAGLATFGVFGVIALNSASCQPRCTDREDSRINTYSAVADIGLAVGVIGAATFGLALLLDDDEDPAPQATTVLPLLDRAGIVGLQAHGTL